VAISYTWSIVTKPVSADVFEILGLKHVGVTTLTFLGHVSRQNCDNMIMKFKIIIIHSSCSSFSVISFVYRYRREKAKNGKSGAESTKAALFSGN